MPRFRGTLFLFSISLFIGLNLNPLARAGDDWLPITAEELAMKSEPKAPGAPAIYLYRQYDFDDHEGRQTVYARLKIFTDEGRQYADIEIPFAKGLDDVKNIQARTIHPDGAILRFEGKPYEKMIVKAKGIQYMAKVFTMPDVQAGSIIEYRFTVTASWESTWILSDYLFTKHAKFSLRRSSYYPITYSWPRGLPEGTARPAEDRGVVRLETFNVPAFEVEDYMPPENEMKYRVEFRYSAAYEKDPEKFWKDEGKLFDQAVERFVDKKKAMEAAVGQIVSPGDTPEQKLQKIYARCQKVRNTSFEQQRTQQEQSREKLKDQHNVEDVWKRGYGDGWDITWLFLALARAAGFDASPVFISTRDRHFFNKNLMNPYDLNTNVALVKLNGKDYFLDPGSALAPFGMLPWFETGVQGLRLDKDGGSWVTTTLPSADDSGMERSAVLTLDESGALEGNATIKFRGMSAIWRRTQERNADNAGRKKFLEDEFKGYIPTEAEVELSNSPDWNASSDTLVAEYKIKIPGWVSAAGRRSTLAVGLFGGGEKHVFEHANRVHPIYFDFPYTNSDQVTIKLPDGMKITNLPAAINLDAKACVYGMKAENKSGVLQINRSMKLDLHLLDAKQYGPLRGFFQNVRSGDEEQVMLAAAN